MKRKIPIPIMLVLLLIADAFGIALLSLASRVTVEIFQAVLFILSMVIIWYASHPLAHYVLASTCKVPVLYFYVGRSELGRSDSKIASRISPLLITIGTKLDLQRLSSVSKGKRAWIYGIGALVGIVLIALIESFALLDLRFGLLSLVLGGLFFFFTLGTELRLGTNSGDLSKMRKELSKPK